MNILYLIYLKELKLCKVGITQNVLKRIKALKYGGILLNAEKYPEYGEALNAERYLLHLLKPYLFNTSLLSSGNTETFIWPWNISDFNKPANLLNKLRDNLETSIDFER